MNINLIKHPEFGAIRTAVIANEVWFCGKDVCKALGYARHHDAMNQHCKQGGTMKHRTLSESGMQEMKFINEGNLYRLILRSQLPAAERFESWVCDEVLPQLRRTGFYGVEKRALRGGSGECMEVMRMLNVIDGFLLHGDKKRIAMAIGVSQQAVNDVLRGHNRSPRILSALYDRALENSQNINGNLYLAPDRAIERLLNPKRKGINNIV